MQCANREGDSNPLAFELIPDIGAHRVVDFIDSGVIAHIEFDLVDHSELGKIDQKNFDLWFRQDTLRCRRCLAERVLHAVRCILILDSNANPHRMDFGWIVKIDDGVAHHLVVWDVQINPVIGAQPGRAPVNLHYFGKALAHLQPVADLVGPVNLD